MGLVAFLISFVGSWIPSLWSDEVATVRASSLPLSDLFHFLRYKDAVHGTYYLLLHAWTGLVGTSELSLRAPSAVAVGVACAGIVAIGRQLNVERTGVIAAVIFAVLPRTTYMGAEARSYALTAALTVVLTIVLLHARKKCTAFVALAYAFIAAVSIVLFIYLALVVIAHIAFLIATRSPLRTVLRIAIASLAAAATLVPFVLVTFGEKNQVAWLGSQPAVNGWTVLVEPWFGSSVAAAAVVWLLLIAGAVRWRQVRVHGQSVLLCLAAAWVVVPTVLLLLGDSIAGPLYTSRYLSFAEPGFAILVAIAATALPWKRATVAAIALLVIASAPTIVGQRTPFAKNGGSDLRQIAEVVRNGSAPGDTVLFGKGRPAALDPRNALYGYPAQFSGLRDAALVESFPTTRSFSDKVLTGEPLASILGATRVVWFISGTTATSNCADLAELAPLLRSGLSVTESLPIHRSTVCKLVRHP